MSFLCYVNTKCSRNVRVYVPTVAWLQQLWHIPYHFPLSGEAPSRGLMLTRNAQAAALLLALLLFFVGAYLR